MKNLNTKGNLSNNSKDKSRELFRNRIVRILKEENKVINVF